MAVTGNAFLGCTVYLYDMTDNLALKTKIAAFDDIQMEIELEEPDGAKGENYGAVKNGATYRVLIIAPSSPYEYMGTAKLKRFHATIALYRGKEKESRQNPRFKIDAEATIESLVYGNRAYALHTPLKVRVLDISKSGARISGAQNAISKGDCFEMTMQIGERSERLLAKVMNVAASGASGASYGCGFLAKDAKVERAM